MKESALRDLIAQKISQLKPGLTLLQKEQYIPGKHGTKSFIDLYARDEKGRHVLIELKRSNIAARQALHEQNVQKLFRILSEMTKIKISNKISDNCLTNRGLCDIINYILFV